MASITTALVGLNVQTVAPGPVGSATADQVLIINLDAANTVNLGSSSTNLLFPLGPQSSIALTAPVYAAAATEPLVVGVAPGGSSFFQPASLANIGGSKVYVQDTAPTGKIPPNSIWFNTASSSLETWDGTGWVTQQFSAQELIQDSTILAAQIADGTLTAAQLAAAAGIIGSQIASATITSGNIAANTIVAANIAANTITAAELAAGIVYAGIINGTTVNAATFTGSTFNGTNWVENSHGQFLYSGTPAAGNLAFSIAPASGTDGFGNAYLAGIWAYNASGGGAALVTVAGSAGLVIPPAGTTHANLPPQIAGLAGNTGLVNEYVGLLLASGQQTTNTGFAEIVLYSETNDGTGGARGALNISGAQVLGWNGTSVTANQPITADTWHNMTLLNSWTLPNGNYYARYQLMPDGSVWIQGRIDGGTTTAGTSIWTPPTGYVPTLAAAQKIPVMVENTTGAATAANPRLEITAAGVALENVASATVISFNGRYSLS